MAVRKPVMDLNNPRLQEQLMVMGQRNANAAIPGMSRRGIYRGFGARTGANVLASKRFADSYNLRERDMAESQRRFGLDFGQRYKSHRDAKSGARIGKLLGLGGLALTYKGNREAAAGRAEERMWRENMMKFLTTPKRKRTGGIVNNNIYNRMSGVPNIT